jgi:hypothetical protein
MGRARDYHSDCCFLLLISMAFCGWDGTHLWVAYRNGDGCRDTFFVRRTFFRISGHACRMRGYYTVSGDGTGLRWPACNDQCPCLECVVQTSHSPSRQRQQWVGYWSESLALVLHAPANKLRTNREPAGLGWIHARL